jgi:lysophospholipase
MKFEITPGEVVRLEGLDLPPNAQFHYIQNGPLRLRVMVIASSRKHARGSVIFQPGRTEIIEKFLETAEELTARGFAVLILDPRGQGLSTRLLPDPLKCYVDSFEDYCDDLAFVVNAFKSDLPRPHVLMGHSMGGTIGLQTVLTGRLNPAACVFTAPMLGLQDIETPIIGYLMKTLAWAGLKKYPLPFQGSRNGRPLAFRLNKLTSDPDRYQLWATYFENHPRLRLGAPTIGWIAEALKAIKFVNDNAKHLNIPTFITACGADPIVTPQSNEEFARTAHADFVNIPGALHEILLERDEYRDQFWTEFDNFLEKYAL